MDARTTSDLPTSPYSQHAYRLRFEWGQEGVRALAPMSDIVVIVDVLSFTTAVSVAVARGASVYPYPSQDESARRYAAEVGAILAGGRLEGGYSLSPTSLARLEPGTRLVLPSPNGATCALLAAEHAAVVLAASLRNASTIAAWIRVRGGTAAIIAAGERWEDGSLRPAAEDLVGAGCVLSMLDEDALSPEARVAVAAYRGAAADLGRFLTDCASGRELALRGYESDVLVAAELDAEEQVPILVDRAFRDAARSAAVNGENL